MIEYNPVDISYLIQIIMVLAFIGLLIMACYLIGRMYICDSETCKAFLDAEEVAEVGSKEYTQALLNNLFADGSWPFPYLGAVIAAGLALYFIGCEITVRTYSVVFFVIFITYYCIWQFLAHHYVFPIINAANQYIDNT